MDRAELILDIFSTRARSHEAKLQVELAQLEYLCLASRGCGLTFRVLEVVSDFAVPAKPSWKPTAGSSGARSESPRQASRSRAHQAVLRRTPTAPERCSWWATPTRASRAFSGC
jgi:hypothetical protein